jgi:hypothetical protein
MLISRQQLITKLDHTKVGDIISIIKHDSNEYEIIELEEQQPKGRHVRKDKQNGEE